MSEEYPYRDRDWLYQKYHVEGLSQSDIAEEAGCTTSVVCCWMKKYNISARGQSEAMRIARNKEYRRYKDPEWLRQKYWDEEMLIPDIAKECDVALTTIRRWMDKHNIKRRSRSDIQSIVESRKNRPKYGDPEWLYEQYWNKKRSTVDIARECGVSDVTIRNWLVRYGIETRSACDSHIKEHMPYHDHDWLCEQYWEKGKSQKEMAQECGVNQQTISDWMNRLGVQTMDTGPKIDTEAYKLLSDEHWLHWQYHGERKSMTEIGKELGLTWGVVSRFIKRYNIEPRPQSEEIKGEHNPMYGDPRKDISGPNSKRWRGGYFPYYGENYYRMRKKALKRDGYVCQKCGALCSGNGDKLNSVHHILPVREFVNMILDCYSFIDGIDKRAEASIIGHEYLLPDFIWGEINSLDNLITLCQSCHRWIENRSPSLLPSVSLMKGIYLFGR